jgi:ribonuclease HI
MPRPSELAKKELILHIDGASRGNPGPAAYAVVAESADGAPVAAISKFLGEATNNQAEYEGLLGALEFARSNGYARLRILSDSELLVRQMNGEYKVKSDGLKPLWERARRAAAGFEACSLRHVPREKNREADRLANRALDGALIPASVARPPEEAPTPLRVRAAYRAGCLEPERQLPLEEGEEVELEIRRQKKAPTS